MSTRKTRVLVACINAAGEPDAVPLEVLSDADDDEIKQIVQDQGYEGPFIIFDEYWYEHLPDLLCAPNPKVDRMLDLAKANDLSDEDFDELVHDVAAQTGSSVNNRGLAAQIEFLVNQIGEQALKEYIQSLGEDHDASARAGH